MEEGAQDGQHERHAHAPDAPSPSIWSSSTSSGSSPLSKISQNSYSILFSISSPTTFYSIFFSLTHQPQVLVLQAGRPIHEQIFFSCIQN